MTILQDAKATSQFSAFDFTHVANVLVLVSISSRGGDVTGVTIGGVAMTMLDGGSYGSPTAIQVSIWYAYRSSAATESVVISGVSVGYFAAEAISFTGTRSSPVFFEGTGKDGGNVSSITITIESGDSGRRLYQMAGEGSGYDITQSAPQIEISEVASTEGNFARLETNYYDDGGVGETMTVSVDNAVRFGSVATAILPAYTASIAEDAIPPSVPHMPPFSEPFFQAYTCNIAFTDILEYEVRLGCNGTVGSFRFGVPDPVGNEMLKVSRNDRIILLLRQGPVERSYTGIIETVNWLESGRRIPTLVVQGHGYGAFLSRRNKAVTYTSRGIMDIMMNGSDGLRLAVPELEWGDYIRDPGGTMSTDARMRTVKDMMNELMFRSGSAGFPWTYWVCHGQHPGETRENMHFREQAYSPSPIVISHYDVLSSERITTMQFLRNQVETEYGSDGASEIRDDATSQSTYGVCYDYAYAPFLTSPTGAQDWGDKTLNKTKGEMKAISLTIPMNLFLEPNYMIRYMDMVSDRQYEVGMVMHRGSCTDRPEALTVLEAGTTFD